MSATSKSIAFFDVDETLITTKSMFDFLRSYGIADPQITVGKVIADMQHISQSGADRAAVNVAFWRLFSGVTQATFRQIAREWTREKLLDREAFFVPSTMERLSHHLRDGHHIALVSGSSHDILESLASELRVHSLLATRQFVVDGLYTGEIASPAMIGAGKEKAASALAAEMEVRLSDCFAYGDHISDLPLLEIVGHPHVVGSQGALADIARERHWVILPTAKRVDHPGATA